MSVRVRLVVVTCEDPGAVNNSVRHGNTFKYQHTVTYQCTYGYYVVGITSLQCTEHGNWSTAVPTCIAYTCDTSFPPPVHATTITSAAPGNFQTNMTVTEGQTILTQCALGFGNRGTASAACTLGEWVPDFQPDCQRLSCNSSIPSGGANTTRTGSGNMYQDVHTFECIRGYAWALSTATLSIMCAHDGTWSAVAPDCTRVACPQLTSVARGLWNSDQGVFEDVVTGQCDSGYELVSGNWSRSCQSDGTWSGTDPTCARVKCPSVPVVSNGGTERNQGNSFGDEVVFYCDAGYDFGSQPRMLTCQANMTWSSSFPTCLRVTCPSPPDIVYSSAGSGDDEDDDATGLPVSTASFDYGHVYIYGHVYSYVCDVGHYLIGANNTTCSQTHNWTNPPPTCHAVECNVSSLPTVSNGNHSRAHTPVLQYNESIVWSCDQGYELQTTNTTAAGPGSGIQQCTHNTNRPGYFSGATPRCERVACPVYVTVANAVTAPLQTDYRYEDTVSITCAVGHEVKLGITSLIATCLSSGNWSHNVAACTIIDCGPIPTVPFADPQGNLSTNHMSCTTTTIIIIITIITSISSNTYVVSV
ncbi:sushi, von Willebrand factor type A, EGF and pentraxin domain-containing protein 1-like [Sycon ciliatum]|uniref:sushi, von Willebrand factor type A, EGF and pentraxin domain-containing protein 1-like n=1 Tax=Sycon ciliatum TaxID=27933 RepID=UPI0031F69131